MQPRVILASRSPARATLLRQLGLEFTIAPAHVDETVMKNENPLAYVRRVARAKASKVAAQNPGCVVVAADTPSVLGRRILQTPETAEEVRVMLRQQSGRRVTVPTVVAVVDEHGKLRDKTIVSWVKLKRLSEREIEHHIQTGLWQGTAGALKLEDTEHWIMQMHGSRSGIMGLPMYETALLLRAAGIKLP
ncbi:MAG: septum formation protein Maf [Proteobacteria bacterium]|nr:septum formation protein Maf [Pseudomonadota bacterium]NBX86070.1 septum formation protein Maf [Pseudomonadota bacterium]